MPVSNVRKPGYIQRKDGKWHKPYKTTKKGNVRKGRMAGARLGYDDTKHSKRSPDTASKRRKGVSTKKGMSRKGQGAGARLGFDATHQEWVKEHHHLGY